MIRHTPASPFGLVIIAALLLLWPLEPDAAPVPVRFAEGVSHGYLLLRRVDGTLIATGDLLQLNRGADIESRMIFRFVDGSIFDETVLL